MGRLRRSSCDEPGFTRVRAGRGFVYRDAGGSRVTDESTLERIGSLVLPPAWRDVWICADSNGHLQAVGTDEAGRRQYRYHERWTERRSREKFDRMLSFAEALPAARRSCLAALRSGEEPSAERVLAAAVRLLDLGLFRIGGEAYAAENESFGLATVRREHVAVRGQTIRFEYPAKSGAVRQAEINSAELAELIRRLKSRRGGGGELLAYKEGRRWRDVSSEEVNSHLKDLAGREFSAKDFRTWNATVLGAVSLAKRADAAGRRVARSRVRRAEAAAVREVAEILGNTAAVCRRSYMDPRLFDRFRAGAVVEVDADDLAEVTHFGQRHREDLETEVKDFLNHS